MQVNKSEEEILKEFIKNGTESIYRNIKFIKIELLPCNKQIKQS